jgi:hypothetical protein
MKKRIIFLVLMVLLVVIVLSQVGFARKGVGLVWTTESEVVQEGTKHCVEYGIYNPWDEDVTAVLSVSGELENVITKKESETTFIKAGTSHTDAEPIDFCFKVAKIYEKDCIMGMLCKQTCEDPIVEYEGKIVAEEEATGETGGTAGSTTSLGVSVPLKLRVSCEAHDRNWTLLYVAVIILALIAILVVFYSKKEKKEELS